MIGTRRRIIRLTGAALATRALGQPSIAFAFDQQDLARLFADPAAAAAIGQAYIRTHPAPRPTLATLQSEVNSALCGDTVAPSRRTPLQARFRARVQQDFDGMRVVMVDGWMLSRVEAQTCAIACLSAEGEL
jgi:hypothetical protein